MDLSTQYLGLELKNPLVASASPLSQQLDGMRRLEDAGVSAIVMFSLFEEQIVRESRALDATLTHGAESFPEALTYFPEHQDYQVGPDAYMRLLSDAKRSLEIPVIASLNGITASGWTQYARSIENAGADAIELNVYFIPTDPDMPGAAVEQRYVDILGAVKSCVGIPVAMKLNPFFSSIPNMARKLAENGASGLVLFNRFFQPDINLDALEVVPQLTLSHSIDLKLPLRWVAILYKQVSADLALTGGAHTSEDVLKAMMAGAKVTMMASSLLRNGETHVSEVLAGMRSWMDEYEYDSVRQMQGSMCRQHQSDPAVFERANYVKAIQSYQPIPVGRSEAL